MVINVHETQNNKLLKVITKLHKSASERKKERKKKEKKTAGFTSQSY